MSLTFVISMAAIAISIATLALNVICTIIIAINNR